MPTGQDSFILNPGNAGIVCFTVELSPAFCILLWIVNLWEGHKLGSVLQYNLVLPSLLPRKLLFSEHLMLLALGVRDGDRNSLWETLIGHLPITE